jgi:hypothetical protein
MDFNFSCKIHHTKVYIAFTKVVVLFTWKLAKLVSHFSVFPWIYMQFTSSDQNTLKRTIYLHPGPQKPLDLHNHALGPESFTDRSPSAEGSSPSVMWARGWLTNGKPEQLGSPSVDLWVWMRRGAVQRGARRGPTAAVADSLTPANRQAELDNKQG